MKFKDIYNNLVKTGIERDPRGRGLVENYLNNNKEKYEALKDDRKEFFDSERLTNPYTDCRILNGDPEKDIKSVLVGIDIDVGEIMMARYMIDKGAAIDAVIAHHPCGGAADRIAEVMWLQADTLNVAGVPINVAEGILGPRIKQVERTMWAANHNKVRDAARLLDIPLMCVHTPADNCVTGYLDKLFEAEKPERVKDVVRLLENVDEYRMAMKDGNGPKIWVGSEERRAGKIIVDMTGGTSGSEHIYEKLSGSAGIGTIVGMHIPEDHRKEAEKHHVNVVIAGHISSDTLGMNLIFDSLADKGCKLEIIETSGFKRISRN